ncbi:TAT leader-containing periplasmic protein [Shewanella sp. KX20019]|uniref:TAT leader-containing periplasmic protein n=1 Tax=Shewanella sp. KX20019 TaxID=2803864 RepID=UPI001927209D|nr:TAT leader-containing periplasmic protein [Shewanella sp. KX20019]QQX79531.1 TAT leader-containing periplasmic protein [Shewanella sp. KX20019]
MERRTFITTALAGTACLALGVNYCSTDYANVNARLDDKHRLLFSVLLPVFLDGALPDVPVLKRDAENRTLDAIEHTISLLPEDSQLELEQLLDLLEGRLGLLILTGSMTPLMMRNSSELIEMLEGWRTSYIEMMVTAYQGLRELVMASYYSEPEHWSRLHYAKPSFLEENN